MEQNEISISHEGFILTYIKDSFMCRNHVRRAAAAALRCAEDRQKQAQTRDHCWRRRIFRQIPENLNEVPELRTLSIVIMSEFPWGGPQFM